MNDQYLGAGEATRAAGPVPRRGPSGLGQRPVLAVSGAAAVVALGGVVAALSGHAPGSATASGGPALVSITGCSALAQVNGTLERHSGGDLVIRTADGTVSVRTTTATRLAVSRAPAGDITVGASVIVATLDQLQAGAPTIAVGHPGPTRTLTAVAVFQPPVTQPGTHASVTLGNDCSPTSVDRAITELTSAG